MRNKAGYVLVLTLLCAVAACQKNEAAEQNALTDQNIPADADIEALPADESSGTSSGELANGAVNPDENGVVSAPDNQTDSY